MATTFAALPPEAGAQPAAEASIGDLMRAMRTHWRYIALPTLLVFLAATIFVSVVSPRYTGEAKVLLQSGDTYYTRPGQERFEQALQIDDQAVASQVQVVMSRDLARAVIRQLGLVGNPEFDPGVREPGLLQKFAHLLGMSKAQDVRAPEERVLEKYYDNLLVYPVGKSRIVSIEFRSKDPDLAAKAANAVATLYLDLQEDAKKDQARSASTWLGTNIDGLRTRVSEAEGRVEAFRSRTGLLTGSGTTTLSAQQLSELSAQLAQARSTRSDAQAKAALIRDLIREGRGFEIPDVANNELIRRLIEQRINLRAQLALELRTLLPQHPRIKELNAQLGDLEGQVRGAAERTARTLENDSRIAGSRVEAVEAAIEQQKKVVTQANEGEVQLRALEREARTQREQLESYLTRYREAMARDVSNAAPPDARIVSRAVAPQVPSFPKKLPIIAITTFAALMLAAGAVVARELLGGGAPAFGPSAYRAPHRVAADLEPEPQAGMPERAFAFGLPRPGEERALAPDPVPAAPPPAPAEPAPAPAMPIVAAVEPVLAAAEPALASAAEPDGRYDFGNLVERLRKIPVTDRARRVLVVGVDGGHEAVNVGGGLALTLSGAERALIVEIDPEDGTPSDRVGLTDLIAGEASFADVIRREPSSRLHRVAAGTLKNEALTSEPEGLDVTLSAFEKTYDWIVCGLASNTRPELLRLFAPRVDAVVVASNLEPANQDLVRCYEAAQNAGALEVLVAREQATPEMDSAAA